ncbi:hypothetical protein ACP70R_021914 [Stipagrostis hirtigluma subsp. patula]
MDNGSIEHAGAGAEGAAQPWWLDLFPEQQQQLPEPEVTLILDREADRHPLVVVGFAGLLQRFRLRLADFSAREVELFLRGTREGMEAGLLRLFFPIHDEPPPYRGGGFRAVPASAAAVARLERQTVRAAAGGGDGRRGVAGCAICLEEFEDGEEVSVVPCARGHEFHPNCIVEWLGRSNMCPLCRHALPTS